MTSTPFGTMLTVVFAWQSRDTNVNDSHRTGWLPDHIRTRFIWSSDNWRMRNARQRDFVLDTNVIWKNAMQAVEEKKFNVTVVRRFSRNRNSIREQVK